MDANQWQAEQFEHSRAHMRAVAYRMLGSRAEAEDAVQETWIRFARSDTGAVENLEGPHPLLTTDEPARMEELRDWLLRGLAYLPVEQRLAVELCYELGFSCEEIGKIMGCPVNTVKTRLFHARAKLQKLLPELGGAAPQAAAPNPNPLEGRSDSW